MRGRKVKILATLGPASQSKDMIRALVEAGADGFRLNMSHESHDGLRAKHATIREIEEEVGRPIAIVVDIQGPKLRIGAMPEGGVQLHEGGIFNLELDAKIGTGDSAPLPHPEIFASLKTGALLLIDDGRIRLQVEDVTSSRVHTRVLTGGLLTSRKGVNVPDVALLLQPLTTKDRADLEFALHLGVDWIALSFIQRAEDIAEPRKLCRGRAAVMAKIEKPMALQHLREITDMSDGLMVARGDLGVELPLEEVPGWQKQIVRGARASGKPVVVATQMLESMITASLPTRAEVSDVATAVFEGADAVMLSAESATGAHPVEAVRMMDRIGQVVERDPNYRSILTAQRTTPETTTADAITSAARQVAETLNVAAIFCYTKSGSTGLRAARERPHPPIVALTPVREIARRLAIVWGLHCVLSEDAHSLNEMIDNASQLAFREGIAKAGQRIVVTAGVPFGTPGATNLLHIAFVSAPQK